MKIINARTDAFFIEKLEIRRDDAWCMVGTNRSGINELFRLICKEKMDITADRLDLPENPGIISFKQQQDIYESELKKEETDFIDRLDPGTPARNFLQDVDRFADLVESFAMTECLDKGYRQLSTGQARKLMVLSQITRGVDFLIFQAPYDGLDPASRNELDKAFSRLNQQHIGIILFVHNLRDIPLWCTHIGVMTKGCLTLQGKKKKVMTVIDRELKKESAGFQASAQELLEGNRLNQKNKVRSELIFLNNGAAGYGGQTIFKDLTLTLHDGDHTLVTGPNGCGKSTLLQVITGDHPACYQNDLRIFGIQRGSGESIWDLKKHMGIVSSELHRNYYVPGSTLHCILSGLFDSIGLYRPWTSGQEQQALTWLGRISLSQSARTPFRDLSYADQRLVLIARALIKLPRLLILDEPTQGLDELNRKAVLDFLEDVARKKMTTLLYVSHRQDEYRNFFCQHIQMDGQ